MGSNGSLGNRCFHVLVLKATHVKMDTFSVTWIRRARILRSLQGLLKDGSLQFYICKALERKNGDLITTAFQAHVQMRILESKTLVCLNATDDSTTNFSMLVSALIELVFPAFYDFFLFSICFVACYSTNVVTHSVFHQRTGA